MLEFPVLSIEEPAQHIAEIGCGCGSGVILAGWLCMPAVPQCVCRVGGPPAAQPAPGPAFSWLTRLPCAPAALLPVLKANSICRVTGCDVSPTALALLRRAAEQAGVDGQRIHTFVLDAASAPEAATSGSSSGRTGSSHVATAVGRSSPEGSPLAGLEADSLLLIFTLSALRPEEQPAALAHAFAALRPGGLLLFRCASSSLRRWSWSQLCSACADAMQSVLASVAVAAWALPLACCCVGFSPGPRHTCRDYGLYDMAQLRFPGAQMLGDNLYRRR